MRQLPLWVVTLLATTGVIMGTLALALILGPKNLRYQVVVTLILLLGAAFGIFVAMRLRRRT